MGKKLEKPAGKPFLSSLLTLSELFMKLEHLYTSNTCTRVKNQIYTQSPDCFLVAVISLLQCSKYCPNIFHMLSSAAPVLRIMRFLQRSELWRQKGHSENIYEFRK